MRRRGSRARQPAEVRAGEPAADGVPVQDAGPRQLPLEAGAEPVGGRAPEQVAEVMPRAAPGPVDPTAQVAEYRRRVVVDGRDAGSRRELAKLLAQRGELALALEQYEAARDLMPEDPTLLLELTETLIALRRFDLAERELRRILKVQPGNGTAYLQLGIVSFRRGLYAPAEQDLQRATELLPDSASASFYRGEALNQLSRLDEALAMLERTVQLEPANGRAYYVMGILYDKKNLPQEAAAMYRKAREVGGR